MLRENVATRREWLAAAEWGLFGFLFVAESAYIAWDIAGYGSTEFGRHWSCWNYVLNAGFYFLVVAGRSGFLRRAMLLTTPFVFGIDMLWAGLTTLVVAMGAKVFVESSGASDDSGWSIDEIENVACVALNHYFPVIATGWLIWTRRVEVAEAFVHATSLAFEGLSRLATIACSMCIMWIPWTAFVVYCSVYDPFDVYGVEEPSTAETLLIFGIGSIVYGTVMLLLVFFVMRFARRPTGPTGVQRIRELAGRTV